MVTVFALAWVRIEQARRKGQTCKSVAWVLEALQCWAVCFVLKLPADLSLMADETESESVFLSEADTQSKGATSKTDEVRCEIWNCSSPLLQLSSRCARRQFS